MHPSLRRCSARAHNPLIKFLGKRSHPSTTDAPHPHPAAPSEVKQHFSEFLAKMNSSGASESTSTANHSSPAVFSEFWEAPPRFWQPKGRQLGEDEMNAIMSGGASIY